jgi:hypothetical protein
MHALHQVEEVHPANTNSTQMQKMQQHAPWHVAGSAALGQTAHADAQKAQKNGQ